MDRGSGDTPRQAIDHEALVKSFGVKGGGGGGSLETSIESGTGDGFQIIEDHKEKPLVVSESIIHIQIHCNGRNLDLLQCRLCSGSML